MLAVAAAWSVSLPSYYMSWGSNSRSQTALQSPVNAPSTSTSTSTSTMVTGSGPTDDGARPDATSGQNRPSLVAALPRTAATLQAPMAATDDRPVAYVIAAKSRLTDERQRTLEAIGFRPERVDPVYMENDCREPATARFKAQWGITNAHQHAWMRIAASKRRGLVLESDWGIGNQNVSDLRAAMARAYARDEHYVSVGWCRRPKQEISRPWFFTCLTAYFLSAEAARNLSRLRHEDGMHAPCAPADAMITGACKGRGPQWDAVGIDFRGSCCWWPGDATDQRQLSFPGYETSQRGLIQQDRNAFKSTHVSGGSEMYEDNDTSGLGEHAHTPGQGPRKSSRALSLLQLSEKRRDKRVRFPWYNLQAPALCGMAGDPDWETKLGRRPGATVGKQEYDEAEEEEDEYEEEDEGDEVSMMSQISDLTSKLGSFYRDQEPEEVQPPEQASEPATMQQVLDSYNLTRYADMWRREEAAQVPSSRPGAM